MKKFTLIFALIASGLLLYLGPASADDETDAKAMVEKAVAMVEARGLEATLDAINDLKGPFVKDSLYVFAMSMDNLRLATGSPYNKSKLGTVGKEKRNKEMAKVAKNPGFGWVEYSWPKPKQDEPSPKRSFVMRVPGKDIYFGCGYYLK